MSPASHADPLKGLERPRIRCFACGRVLSKGVKVFMEDDDQAHQLVGRECFGLIQAAGADGYAPSKGGPRLFARLEDACAFEGITPCACCLQSPGRCTCIVGGR